jgi:hypothetical protein
VSRGDAPARREPPCDHARHDVKIEPRTPVIIGAGQVGMPIALAGGTLAALGAD